MEVRQDNLVAVHHFDLKAQATDFYLETKQLRPYLLTEGRWLLRVLYLGCNGQVSSSSSPFGKAFRIVSPNIAPENGNPLVLAAFGQEDLEKKGKAKFFPTSQAHLITMKSDRVYFNLQSLDGGRAQLEEGGLLLLGVELLQIE